MSRDFLFKVFFMNHLSPSPWKWRKDRFKFFQKSAEIFASQGAPTISMTPSVNFATGTTGIVDSGCIIAAVVNDSGGKFPPTSTTPAVNLPPVVILPPVSTTWVAKNGNNIRLLRHKKLIHMLRLLPKGVKKIIKIFLIEDFFRLPPVSPVSTTPVANGIPRIYKKNWNGIPRVLGETDS